MSAFPFPITGAKIHPPLLRSDTLTRPRLNKWLDAAARGRVALVIADAGFGKTTFLADWAAHSDRRTIWYRLEPDDADWLVFQRHLLASARELDPDVGHDVMELLLALETGTSSRDEITAALARAYRALAQAQPSGLTLILDDHHAVDGSPLVAEILRALLDVTGPVFSIVIASRATPALPFARVRAHGGMSRLEGADLCFSIEETDRLFREAYRHPLEADVVQALAARTEGWAALLMLVRTGLDDKDPSGGRALVMQLSAARGDLYDFFAEEIVSALDPELERFLVRAAILVSVDTETGAVVADRRADEIVALIAEAERLGLLTRPDRESAHRFHALVRDFLVARLEEEIGEDAVLALHRRVAIALEPADWLGAAWHYRAGAAIDDAVRVVDAAVPSILATGAFELAAQFLDGSAGSPTRPAALVLRSRLELERTGVSHALSLAQSAVAASADTPLSGTALLNLAALDGLHGYGEQGRRLATEALAGFLTADQRLIAEAIIAMSGIAVDSSLLTAEATMSQLAATHLARGLHRYAAVSLLNHASLLAWLGRQDESLAVLMKAEEALHRTRTQGIELGAILGARAATLAELGRTAESAAVLETRSALGSDLARLELTCEAVRVHSLLGSRLLAERALAEIGIADHPAGFAAFLALVKGDLRIRQRDLAGAQSCVEALRKNPCRDTAGLLRTRLLEARCANLAGSPEAVEIAQAGLGIAHAQESPPGIASASLLAAMFGSQSISDAITSLPFSFRYVMSTVAEEISARAHELNDAASMVVLQQVQLRPERWRDPLLWQVEEGGPAAMAAAMLLAKVATREDAFRLRELAARRKALRVVARAVTVALAEHIYLEDLGHVRIRIGERRVRVVRRKVQALLCFLASRPQLTATRDEVIDALWPEMNPDTAGNSLHQTIYFLRRVFEPDFRDGLSADYVTYDGEVVALSADLIRVQSRECWQLATTAKVGSTTVADLLDRYEGRYAIDFAYEDWASDWRDHLHAAVLGASEAAMAKAIELGNHEVAIEIGHRVLAVDPQADAVEIALLRAYKASGRTAAAAEQYGHYASYVRTELASEPIPYEEI